MSLMNLSQFKSLRVLRKDVDLLLQSYEAGKVLTKIVKNETENYNLDELLAELKDKLETVTGEKGNGQSLFSIKKAIDELKNKPVQVYANDTDAAIKEYKLAELPGDALLHGGNLDIKAYQDALDALVAKLAANEGLINAVKELIGEGDVKDKISAAVEALKNAPSSKASIEELNKVSDSVQVVSTKIKKLEGNFEVEVQDVIALGDLMVDLPLSAEPNSKIVRMYANGAVYHEGDDFNINRANKSLEWIALDDEDDFRPVKENAKQVTVKYYTVTDISEPPFDPSVLTINESKILLTREKRKDSFQVVLPEDHELAVTASNQSAIKITITQG